ncbi:hypothetical protein ZOD2009_17093 [Haladaptatus paucihalophilus DX253]|uniref:Uncharacterized protein n=1 Tax=Haladaptatus paucihalophilus DX253 TaxID=797209 RepID=E7QX80_HALPU|nr:hypothetical protein ZOD2009_17093 [Haladaptatus paucihalophilus DX253]SHK24899.1 hypothetical protein SAMN05444342_1099 [Haladaptatus paucihalophilus DX253]
MGTTEINAGSLANHGFIHDDRARKEATKATTVDGFG